VGNQPCTSRRGLACRKLADPCFLPTTQKIGRWENEPRPRRFARSTSLVVNPTSAPASQVIPFGMSETDWEKYTRVNMVEIARLIANGDLRVEIEGSTLRVHRTDLERLIAEGKLPPNEPDYDSGM
jgi:hypothetical protein